MSNEKDLAYYLRLPYEFKCYPAEDSDGSRYWIAEFPDIMGCAADGDTRVEAGNNARELFKEMVEVIIESNNEVPEPIRIKKDPDLEIILEATQTIPVFYVSVPTNDLVQKDIIGVAPKLNPSVATNGNFISKRPKTFKEAVAA